MFFHFIKIKVLFLILFSNFSCMSYLFHLGNEQLNQLVSRKKIKEIIASNKETNKILKEKLKLVQKIQNFAISKLYLNPKSKYIYFYAISRKEVGWNLSASYPLKLKSYTWWFPIIGTVPYKGFFKLNLVRKEEKELKAKNLDTRIRITGGYSTLGWFSDPIFSPQLELSETDLAGLIIHEMSHATVYINSDALFNESYASFIEKEGVKRYLLQEKKDLNRYEKELKNKTALLQLKQETAKKLNRLYQSEKSREEKMDLKSKIIQEFKEKVIQKGLFDKQYINIFRNKKLNNEDFISSIRYHSGDKFFYSQLKSLSYDFKKFHKEMKKLKRLKIEERKKILLN